MLQLANPFPLYLDQHGALLDAGKVYVGTANADPEASPVTVYWDSAATIPATQPLRTLGGLIVNNGVPSQVFVNATDYSTRVRDADGNQVSYTKSAIAIAAPSYQPLDSDLTAIAALSTTTFGRSLLTAADAPGLKTIASIIDGLPTTGGTVTGNITRSGAGPHVYHNDSTYVSGCIFVTANGAADPTSQAGHIWLELAP